MNEAAFPISVEPRRPVLIAGPTASGKSALALEIARAQGGVIVNADAMQVYDGWRILSARPDAADRAAAPHALYGHVPRDAPYSTGQWLRDVAPYLDGGDRPIIVGGTGLNFAALTEGLAEIPPVDEAIRQKADKLSLAQLLDGLDPRTRDRLDTANRARVQRAWEVLHSTGQPLSVWQDETPPPRLPLDRAVPLVLDAPKDWLSPRIAARFDQMLEAGLIAEAEAMKTGFSVTHPSSRIIGAAEMVAHVSGDISLGAVREAIVTRTRQYAKRQRTWFRKRMRDWHWITVSSTDFSTGLHFAPDKTVGNR